MDHGIRHRPSFALLDVSLDRDESVVAEAGAMVSHGGGVEVTTDRGGGSLLHSVKRSVRGGESFFRDTFTASERPSVTLAPPLPGEITHRELRDVTLSVQPGSYLAADAAMDLDAKFGGSRTFFGSRRKSRSTFGESAA